MGWRRSNWTVFRRADTERSVLEEKERDLWWEGEFRREVRDFVRYQWMERTGGVGRGEVEGGG